MIDWISGFFRLSNTGDLRQVITKIDDGELVSENYCPSRIEGSFSSSISIKSISEEEVYISGNPVKFLQGHNIFGTDDLLPLMASFLLNLSEKDYRLNPTESDIESLWNGDFRLTRIDLTYSYSLGSREEVLSWIRSASDKATMKYRGKGIFKGSTLYFGKHSTRSSVKFYSKGQELVAHPLPPELACTSLPSYADSLLRVELTLRAPELKKRCLEIGASWDDEIPQILHSEYISTLEITENMALSTDKLEELPSSLRSTYHLWSSGYDLRTVLTKRTFYRHRRLLLDHDVDIAVSLTKTPHDYSNVVPLIKYLEATPASVPDWAYGTNLYFEPKQLRVIK